MDIGRMYVELCSHCSCMLPSGEHAPAIRTHHPNLAALVQSSKSCVLCRMIQDTWILEEVQRRFPEVDEWSYESIALEVKLQQITHSAPGLSRCLLVVDCHIPSRKFTFTRGVSIETCDAKSPSASLPAWKGPVTSTDEKLSSMQTWLSDCEENHPKCRPQVAPLPKRLLEVNLTAGRPTTRLILSNDLRPRETRYATLSYCWGKSEFVTTQENVELYSREIPMEKLPPTFQDAVAIACTLKVPYLWIDALCIVQNDDLELSAEIARMQEVYSGSVLTIASSDAPDTSVGCLIRDCRGVESSARTRDLDDSILVTIRNIGGNGATLLRMEQFDTSKMSDDAILNTRGWALQEMILSHRTVHCMLSSQLQWHCRTVCRRESGIEFDPLAMRHNIIPLPVSRSSQMNEIWWKWMRSYSERRFKYPKDRLRAMAGIVQHYQDRTGDVEILGLWERTFHQDLLWMRIGKMPDQNAANSAVQLPNIPSWSWLSCPTEIDYDIWNPGRADVYDHVNLVDWEVTWTGEPLVSDVRSTRLVLNGPVCKLILSAALEATDYNPPYLNVGDEKPDFDSHPIPWRCAGQFDFENRTTPAQYLCLLLRSRIFKNADQAREIFLMLEPSPIHQTEHQLTYYRRVGLAQLRGENRSFDLTARRTLNLV